LRLSGCSIQCLLFVKLKTHGYDLVEVGSRPASVDAPFARKWFFWRYALWVQLEKGEGIYFDSRRGSISIDSKLRGCDLIRIRICNPGAEPEIPTRVIVVQQKTDRPVQLGIPTM